MSYITWDYYCPTCRTTEERFVKREQQEAQFCQECEPAAKMIRRTAAPPTTFTFADKSANKRRK